MTTQAAAALGDLDFARMHAEGAKRSKDAVAPLAFGSEDDSRQ